MISFVLLVVVTSAIVCIIGYWIIRFSRFKDINKLPGPSAFETIRRTMGYDTLCDKYTYMCNLNKKYGSVFKIWIKPLDPVIVVTDLEYIDKILMSKIHVDKTKLFNLMRPYIGDGLATARDANVWRKERRICNLAFQPSTIKGFVPIFAKHTEKLFEILKNQREQAVDVQHLLHFYTLDIIFESMTKEAQCFQENKDCMYLSARDVFFKIISERIFSIILRNDFLFRFTSLYSKTYEASNTMRNYTTDIINKQVVKNGGNQDSNGSLLDVLLANKIEDERINDHINTFVLAGHDPVGQAICFALYEISRNPDVKGKLVDELNRVLGKNKDAEIGPNDLQQMKYLEAFMKEILRFYTIIPIIERKICEDICINGINYPGGTVFMFQLDVVHKSEKYFKNANTFDPYRFMPENAHLLQKNTFLAFSTGPRDCIGKQFAMLELQFSIAKILQKFDLKPVENHEMEVVHEITVVSKTGIPVIFEERKH